MLISTTTRQTSNCVQIITYHVANFRTNHFQNSLAVSDHVYFVHPSTDISVDISTMLDRYVGCHIDRHIDRDVSVDILTEISADISANTRPIFRSICRPRIVRQSAEMSIDRLFFLIFFIQYLSRDIQFSKASLNGALTGYRHSTDTALILAYW